MNYSVALAPGKEPSAFIGKRLCGPQSHFGRGDREVCVTSPQISIATKNWASQGPVRRQATTLTEVNLDRWEVNGAQDDVEWKDKQFPGR
jgi:hypothetical protein